jgi:hypothetical protein
MQYTEQSQTSFPHIPVGQLSAVMAMLHFDRTGRRPKPHLVVVNAAPQPTFDQGRRPMLRVVR